MRLFALLLLAALLAGCGGDEPLPTPGPASPTETAPANPQPRVAGAIASGLEVPWGIAFLPDGSAIVTERDSRRVLQVRDGSDPREIGTIGEAEPGGEAGLLGVAVSPDFERDRRLFFYYSAADDNRVVRTTFDSGKLGRRDVILDGIPRANFHDGGRLAFGPDNQLYVATGDGGEPDLAQDKDSLGGKILRVTQDGDPAPGNPFSTRVWSYGHRNIQGLAWDNEGALWASEFGQDEQDELNKIVAGRNYGWPFREGTRGDERKGLTDPHLTWATDDASPSGLAFAADHLWMAGLNGERLWRIAIREGRATGPQEFFTEEFGRLRTVVVAPDGRLWVTTSNHDGRGDPAETDDRILVVELR